MRYLHFFFYFIFFLIFILFFFLSFTYYLVILFFLKRLIYLFADLCNYYYQSPEIYFVFFSGSEVLFPT